MAGEMLADGQSPMMMTVDQYNERVARTWALATEAEKERIIKLLEPYLDCSGCDDYRCSCERSGFFIALIKGEQK